jgi:hypothetical protein
VPRDAALDANHRINAGPKVAETAVRALIERSIDDVEAAKKARALAQTSR